jgi:TfoX/Sxy family transcriptional regulator of competence genes
MAKEYLEKLSKIIEELNIDDLIEQPLEVKHFFSGAALYIGGTICASWSPVGLAFKLSEQEAKRLISNGSAKPLKYFPNGPIKKGYALFVKPCDYETSHWIKYLLEAVQQA